MLILLMSAQKSYLCDNDAIYDVVVQEPVRKWRHNNRHEISRYLFAELLLFQTNSTICILQIDRANFAVRGPSFFNLQASHEASGPTFQTLSIKLS